jgi:membrane-bound metal-dependent hydrolase YbcI (DUF457 family)
LTPLGHASLSYIVGRRWNKAALLGLIAGGLLLDIDFIFLPFSFFNAIHRVVTHNVFFVFLLALAAGLLARTNRFEVVLSVLAGGALHLAFDAVMDNNATNGIGIALFWPVSNQFFSPFNLTPPDPSAGGWDDLAGRIRTTLPDLALEIPFYCAFVYLWWRDRGSDGKRKSSTSVANRSD